MFNDTSPLNLLQQPRNRALHHLTPANCWLASLEQADRPADPNMIRYHRYLPYLALSRLLLHSASTST